MPDQEPVAQPNGDSMRSQHWDELSVTVVGAGYMGLGIAQVLAGAGAQVRVTDTDETLAATRVSEMIGQAAQFEAEGLLPAGRSQSIASRVSSAGSISAGVSDADLVIEAVTEDKAVKHAVLREIERCSPGHAVIASNTSSIRISELADALEDRSRLLGVHWFNPPQFVPGVEIIPTPDTAMELAQQLSGLLEAAGKTPVIVNDSAGFVANRLQFALFREAALMVEDGSATADEIDTVVTTTFGYRLPFFGPFAIADMAGLDVYAGAYTTLERAYGARFSMPAGLAKMVQTGRLGTKTGGGFLDLDSSDIDEMISNRNNLYSRLSGLIADIDGDTASPV